MSWLKVDDGFEDHPKVEGLSNDAHRLWMRAACWCRKPVNARTAGFVPRALLEQIAKRMAPPARLLELVDELVAATAGGMFKHGLWEPREGGWVFHDWAVYQPETEPGPAMSRAEAARVAGKRSAEVRRLRNGSAQPERAERRSNVRSEDSGARTIPRTSPERRSEEPNRSSRTTPERPERRSTFDEQGLSVETRAVSEVVPPQSSANVSRTSPERPEPPDPLPLPVPRSEAADLKTPQVARAQQAPRIAAAAAGVLPRNLEQALELAICPRAAMVRDNTHHAEWVQPHRWPEVIAVAEALHQAAGLGPVRLGTYARDSGVRAVVELFAAGYMPSDLKDACRRVVGDPWWAKGDAKRGLSSLSPAVVRAALAGGLTPAQQARVNRAMGTSSAPTALGASLAKVLPNGGGD